MTHADDITPAELAQILTRGDPLQVLDVRAPQRLASGIIETPETARFVNLPNSKLFALQDPAEGGLERAMPVITVCGHGNSSKQAAGWLGGKGYQARSLRGGMAAWMQLLVPHTLLPPVGFSKLVQFDRLGKGALAYLLIADGEALIVDPPRDASTILAAVADAGARLVGVADTHVHADYISGAPALAERHGVPYYLHAADAVFPYDGTPGKIGFEKIEEGQEIRVGQGSVRVLHTPGHTEGSVTFVAGNAALTGDFLFVASIGRPDLAGKTDEWAQWLWTSLVRVRAEWPADLMVLPAHYTQPEERRTDGVIGVPFGDLPARNAVHRITDRAEFLAWIKAHEHEAPAAYREIKAINVRLKTVTDLEAEELEAGKSECAVS